MEPHGLSAGSTALGYANNAKMADCVQVAEPSQHDQIGKRLAMLAVKYGENTRRIIELGSRAFGGSPVGSDKAAGQASGPQPAGSLASIAVLLDELEHISQLQFDAVSFADRIA